MQINRRRILEFSGAAGLTVAAGWTFLVGEEPVELVSAAKAQDLSNLMQPGPMGDKFLGKEDAPVTVIEYASMTCGHCAAFHKDTLPAITEKYVDTGKIKLIFREFPFDPRATAAFMLARCAPEERYFPLVDLLFKQQGEWARVQDPVPPLLKIAKLAGFTQETFNACLKNQEILDSVLAVKNKAAEDYKVDSTPTFFINGEKYSGNMSVEAMSEAIDGFL